MDFKLLFSLLIPVVLSSCGGDENQTESEESNQQEEQIELDSFEADESDDDFSDEFLDTTYFLEYQSNFDSPQIQKDIYYVYWKLDLLVCQEEQLVNILYSVSPGGPLTYIDEVYRFEVLDDFHGKIFKVAYRDQEAGFVHSAFLSQMPYPRVNSSLLDYALNNLQQTAATQVEERLYRGEGYAGDGENRKETYFFEDGIILNTWSGYESYEETLKIPNGTLNEGLVLMNAIASDMKLHDLTEGKFPSEKNLPENAEEEEIFLSVEYDPSSFPTSVKYTFGDGCSNWYSVYYEGDYVVINIGGGC